MERRKEWKYKGEKREGKEKDGRKRREGRN